MDSLLVLALLGVSRVVVLQVRQTDRQPQRLPRRPIAFPALPLISCDALQPIVHHHHDQPAPPFGAALAVAFFYLLASGDGRRLASRVGAC